MMKRWLPAPLLSASLVAMWLVLNRSLDAAHILMALLLAWLMPLLMLPLRPRASAVRRPLVLTRLILRVGYDVIRSGLIVARGILFCGSRPLHNHFVVIPLELRDEYALASLAMIATVVPGTVWSEVAPDRSALLMHVFGVTDEAAFIEEFKTLYEKPLLEIFP
jgi:multicomponent K+:H+ antiporter subunit E